MIGALPEAGWVVLDEIQKIPALLDEVHRVMETRHWRFALCGSSARKLKRGGANLLAGRAVTRSMEGFSAAELGPAFKLENALDWGLLPAVCNAPDAAADILSAYVSTYLKEELMAEGILRQTPPFIRFLAVAGLLNGSAVNMKNVSRDAGVAHTTVVSYFTILTDTLLAHFLPAWRPKFKVRETAHPKLYWFDPGVARAAAGLLQDQPDRAWQGLALETLVYHELRVYNENSGRRRPLFFYGTSAGREIDFLIETGARQQSKKARVIAIEVKRSEKWDRSWEKPMLSLLGEKEIEVDALYGIYGGTQSYRFGPVEVLPAGDFIKKLFKGEVY
jgi:predicted AAA+ superfamily ATPase